MFKKSLLVTGIIGAALLFQSAAVAEPRFSITINGGHSGYGGYGGGHGGQVIEHQPFHKAPSHPVKHKRKHFSYEETLSDSELRYVLRRQGLYRIHIHHRQHDVAKITAQNSWGKVGKYLVSTRNGQILEGRILNSHGYGNHGGFRNHGKFDRHRHSGRGQFVIRF